MEVHFELEVQFQIGDLGLAEQQEAEKWFLGLLMARSQKSGLRLYSMAFQSYLAITKVIPRTAIDLFAVKKAENHLMLYVDD